MSYEQHQLDTIVDIQADFDMALAEKKWDDAKALIQQMGDLGYETEAVFLHQAYNRAIAIENVTNPVPGTPVEPDEDEESDADKKLHKEEIDAEIDGTEDRLRDDSF